ncbi:Ig-like domain-containing protein, partial [Fastidiosibacter lacustris]|uniref:Ig-like domain-containing protein n=1 Tax=Fastidiosibacter lacustris TaxID=2056695 RepID=UPI00195A5354
MVYYNTSDNPAQTVKQIQYVITDANSLDSANNVKSLLTITTVNDAPEITVPSAQSVNEDTLLNIDGISVTDKEGMLTSVELQVTQGVLNVNLSGATISAGANNSNQIIISGTETEINNTLQSLTYQGNANFNGVDSLTVTAYDNGLPAPGVQSSATVTINVNSINDAPTAANGMVTIAEDTIKTFEVTDFNFSDVDDGDALASIKVTSLPTAGTLKLNNVDVTVDQVITKVNIESGLLTFTPANNANGSAYASFGFKVNDGTIDSVSTYTMSIDVTPVNDAPIAANSTVMGNENSDYTFKVVDFKFEDIDADPLNSIKVTTLEQVGSLKLSGVDVILNQVISRADIDAGNLKFTPIANQNGLAYDSFDFSVNDGTVDSVTSYTMSIDISIAGDANGNGMIDYPDEIAGDTNGNGVIDDPDEIAGDANGNGVIDDPNEIAGDANGNGMIDDPNEIAGDINGNGVIDTPNEIAGDTNGNGVIDDPDEIAGDANGNGVIDTPNEIAGDANGNGVIDIPNEIAGDINGNGVIDNPNEIAGDANGNGRIDSPNEVFGDIDGDGKGGVEISTLDIHYYLESIAEKLVPSNGTYIISGAVPTNAAVMNFAAVTGQNELFTDGGILNTTLPSFIGDGTTEHPLIGDVLANKSILLGSILSSDHVDAKIIGLSTQEGSLSIERIGNLINIYFESSPSFIGMVDFSVEVSVHGTVTDIKQFVINVQQTPDVLLSTQSTSLQSNNEVLEMLGITSTKLVDAKISTPESSSQIENIIVTEFKQALDMGESIDKLSNIAMNLVRQEIEKGLDVNNNIVIKSTIQQAIEAQLSTKSIG